MNPEQFDTSSFRPEGAESTPKPKHRVSLENSENTATLERQEWLTQMFPLENGELSNPEKAEYAQVLDSWSEDIPSQSDTIAELRSTAKAENWGAVPQPEPIPHAIYDAFQRGDKEALVRYKKLGADIVDTYDGRQDGKEWEELSEEHKRNVRLGELTVFTVDMLNASQSIQEGNPEKYRKHMEQANRYQKSVDLPPAFGSMLYELFPPETDEEEKKRKRRPRASNISLTPWEAGTLDNLWGNKREENKKNDSQQVEESARHTGGNTRNEKQPPREAEIVSSQEKITGPEGSIVEENTENIIDMAYNPETKRFEPAQETDASEAQSEQLKIEYKPDTDSPPGESPLPPSTPPQTE